MLCTFALTSAAVVIALAPGLSQAQQAPCDAREKFLSKLGKDFTEHPVSLGLASNGTVLEVLASELDHYIHQARRRVLRCGDGPGLGNGSAERRPSRRLTVS
jgi:hypothetical protein